MRTLIFLLVSAWMASAAEWHVATDGSDTNSGTAEQPFLTLSRALSSVAPGDTITIGAGQFSGSANTSVSGTAANPILIQGGGTNVTTLQGGTLTLDEHYYQVTALALRGVAVEVSGNSNLLHGVRLHRAARPLKFVSGSGGNTLSNSVFHHWQANGGFDVSGGNHLIVGNYFTKNNGFDVHRINGLSNTVFQANTYDGISSAPSAPTTSTTSNTIGTGEKVFTVDAGLTGYEVDQAVEALAVGAPSTTRLRGWVVSYSGTTLTMDAYTTSGSGTWSDWTINLTAAGNHADIWQWWIGSLTWFTRDITYERNLFTNITSQTAHSSTASNPDVDPMNVTNHVVRNNIWVNSRFYWGNAGSSFRFFNNTIYNAGTKSGSSGILNPGGDGPDSPQWNYNNIYCRMAPPESGGVYSGIQGGEANYNLITDLDDTAKTGYSEVNGINGGYTPNQIFVDADNGDLQPLLSGPANGLGANLYSDGVLVDYFGNARPSSGDYTAGAIQLDGAIPPAGPSTLTAAATGTTTVDLEWVDVSGEEDSYEVQHRVGLDGLWTTVISLPANSTDYTVNDLMSGTLYYFRVRACATVEGCSDWTNEAAATTLSPGVGRTPGPQQRGGGIGVGAGGLRP